MSNEDQSKTMSLDIKGRDYQITEADVFPNVINRVSVKYPDGVITMSPMSALILGRELIKNAQAAVAQGRGAN